MLFEDAKIIGFKQYKKSNKVSFFIYIDLECLLAKIDGFKSNTEISSTKKVGG